MAARGVGCQHTSQLLLVRPQNTLIRSVGVLLVVAVATAACGSGTGTTTETVATPPEAAPEETNSQDQAGPADTPSGETEVALVWTESELSGDAYIDHVIATSEGFIAYRTDEGARAWVSQDGVSWSEADLDFGSAGAPDFHAVTSSEFGYLAPGTTSATEQALWISQDGLNWTHHQLDLDLPPGEFDGFHQVVSFEGGLLLVGSILARGEDEHHAHQVVLAYSQDGLSWEVLPDSETLFGPGAQVGEIISTGRALFAIGYVEGDEGNGGERIWVSSDGRSWEESPADFLDGPGYYLGPGLEAWGDKLLVVGGEHGLSLHTTVDGQDWEELPSDPLFESTEEFTVYAHEVAAGPLGIVVIAQYEPAQQEMPPVTIEKDGYGVTVDVNSGVIAVTDLATRTPIFESDVEDEELISIDDEAGIVTFLDPDTGGELTSLTFEEFDQAMEKAVEDAGFEDPDYSEPGPSVLFFSPDGQRWSSVSVAEINPSSDFPNGVIVGNDALIVRFPDMPESEEDYEEEPTDLYGHLPDFIWVGRLGGGQ